MYNTFVYSPEVRVVIEGVDVSADVVSGSVRRVVDSASSLSLVLSNKDFRYTATNQFRRMDRVVVWMRRVGQPIKVFTGYLNVVPGIQLYPSTVRLEASCTIKRLLYTYWDPGLVASKELLNQRRIPWGEHPEGGTASASTDADDDADADDPDNATPDDELDGVGGGLTGILDDVDIPDNPNGTFIDGGGEGLIDTGDTGLAMMLQNILVKVGGWDPDTVEIAEFPEPFFQLVMANMPDNIAGLDTAGMEKMRDMFDFYEKIQGSVGGTGATGELGPMTATQMEHAKEVRRAAKDMRIDPEDDAVILAYMTVFVESPQWKILANPKVPESMTVPNEGVGHDHLSTGLFQQQTWWGTNEQRMNAYGSATLFYDALLKQPNWSTRPKGEVCQAVQGSAYPHKYAPMEGKARDLLAQVKAEDPDAKGASGDKPKSDRPDGGKKPGSPAPNKPSTDTSKVDDPTAPNTAGMRVNDAIEAIACWRFPDTWSGENGLNSAFSKDRFTDSGMHSRAQACDMSNGGDAGTPEMKALAEWWYENYLGKGLQELIYAHFNNNVGHDQNVGDGMGSYYGPSTMADHRNHVHIGMTTVPSPDGTSMPYIGGGGAGAAGGSIQWENNLAKNLFTYLFSPERFDDELSEQLTGKHASLNDQPLIKVVQALCSARMCHFQSAPDGSFSAFYPDYFGLDGTAPNLMLEDIEIKDFTISINDNALATHVFSQGSHGPDPGTMLQGVSGFLTSPGMVTVEDEWLFKIATNEMYFAPEFSNPDELLGRYGIRPFRKDYPNINSLDNPAAMLVVAIKLFMEKWAQQYQTQVALTFMPELFPGMRLQLASHNMAVYVESVTHTFDYSSSFSTTCSVMAPVQPRSKAERDAMWEAIKADNAKKDEDK